MTEAQAHRIIVPRRGGPEVLEWVAMDMPEPGPDEVRVRVEAAGVSAYDVMLRGHWFPGLPSLPYTPGEDIVGTVDRVGARVMDLQVGQRVGGWTFGDAGGYAEYLCRPADDLVPVPDGLDPATACALIVNYLTASLALRQTLKISEGERLLVQGAAGGLGSALLQLSRDAGLQTFGCDATSKQTQIRADGASPIDYQSEFVVARTRALTGGGADVVIDLVGGARQLVRSWRCLRSDGRLLMLGMAGTLKSGTWIILPSLLLLGLFSVWPGGRRIAKGPGMEDYPRAHLDWYRNTLSELFHKVLAGQLHPHIAHKLALRDAAEAHAMLERGAVAGKIVLITGDRAATQ